MKKFQYAFDFSAKYKYFYKLSQFYFPQTAIFGAKKQRICKKCTAPHPPYCN